MEIEITKGLNYKTNKKEIEIIEAIEKIDKEIKQLEMKMISGKINTLSDEDQKKYFNLCASRKNKQSEL